MARKRINFLKFEDVAEILTVSEDTVRRLVAKGQLPAYKIGDRTRIDEEDVYIYLEEHRTKAAELRKTHRAPRRQADRPCPYKPGDKVV
ncbi:MAG: helix-turn-helix domain-containing protein [Firmicutes bacterium]|nr:helix-turn-helix domain-containing protein [Bacillota bacterium]